MTEVSRRTAMAAVTALATASGAGLGTGRAAAQPGFMTASSHEPDGQGSARKTGPGLQRIAAICEVTGGGEKVYGIAVEYDAAIDPTGLDLGTYATSVFPAAKGFFPGMPQEPDKNAVTDAASLRPVAAVYTSDHAALRPDRRSVPGHFVIAEFSHDPDLSLPSTDSDRVVLTQLKPVKTVAGTIYAASEKLWSNAGPHGNSVVIRGVDTWEQNHWWWDDTRATGLEYSIYLPKILSGKRRRATSISAAAGRHPFGHQLRWYMRPDPHRTVHRQHLEPAGRARAQ